jgi:hypothetical protein
MCNLQGINLAIKCWNQNHVSHSCVSDMRELLHSDTNLTIGLHFVILRANCEFWWDPMEVANMLQARCLNITSVQVISIWKNFIFWYYFYTNGASWEFRGKFWEIPFINVFGLDSSCINPCLYIVAYEGHFNIIFPFIVHAVYLGSSREKAQWTKHNNDTHNVKVLSFVFSVHTNCLKLWTWSLQIM